MSQYLYESALQLSLSCLNPQDFETSPYLLPLRAGIFGTLAVTIPRVPSSLCEDLVASGEDPLSDGLCNMLNAIRIV